MRLLSAVIVDSSLLSTQTRMNAGRRCLSGEPSSSIGSKGTGHTVHEPENVEAVSLIRGGAFYRLQELARLI